MNEPDRLRELGRMLEGDDRRLCYVAAYEIERHRARLLRETGGLRDEVQRLRAAVLHLIRYSLDDCGCFGESDDPCPHDMPGDPFQTVWPRPEPRWADAQVMQRPDGMWFIAGDKTDSLWTSEEHASTALRIRQENEAYDAARWDRWFGGAP